nr:F-box containing protein [Marseillevirus futianmevirus]
MDSLPNELSVRILSFLQVKDAIVFSTTSSHYRDLVLSNARAVQDTVVRVSKYTGKYNSTKTTNIHGVSKFLAIEQEKMSYQGVCGPLADTLYECARFEGEYLKGKKNGIWKSRKCLMDGTVNENVSLWDNGKLVKAHKRCQQTDYICLPKNSHNYTPVRETIFSGELVDCVLIRNKDEKRRCGDAEYAVFRDRHRKRYSFCCEKHSKGMPSPLMC